MPSSRSKGYLPTLDGWRAIAILGVVGDHVVWGYPHLGRFGHIAIGLMGEKGVTLFFGTSGFLITWRLLEEQEKLGAISLRAFYIRRAFRILPTSTMYLVAIGLLAFGGFLTVNPYSWLSALLFYRDYSNTADWFTGHFWSLSIEEHFYFFWSALRAFLCLRRLAPPVTSGRGDLHEISAAQNVIAMTGSTNGQTVRHHLARDWNSQER